MTKGTTRESTTLAGRLRQRLRSFEPLYLGLLALLAIPSYVFESLAALQVFEVFFLVFLWPFVAPLVAAVLRRGTDEDEAVEPTDWIHMGTWREYAAWLFMLPVTFLNPLVLAQDAMQFVGGAVAVARHRGSVPDAESYEQRASYRLQFDGAWTVANGSHEKDYSHSWFPLNQRYAYDFVITDTDGRTRPEGAASRVDRYYCYDEPVLAPADGVVVDVCDGDFESARAGGLSHPLKRDIRGNYVVVQHAPDEYSCLAHLVPGSVTVEPGDRVARGQQIGRCGHSGNSSEPHLHFQVQDHPDFEIAASLPVAFDDVALEWPGAEAPIADPLLDERGATDMRGEDDLDGLATDAPIDVADVAGLEDGTYRARAHVSAGQRVAHVGDDDDREHAGRERSAARDAMPAVADAQIGRPSNGRRAGIAALQGVGFGACVGGVAAFVWPIFLAPSTVAVLLGAAAVVAATSRIGAAILHGTDGERHLGSSGTVVGVGVAAAVVIWYARAQPTLGIGAQTLGLVLLLLGFVGYAVVGEYDRRRLGDAFRDSAGLRPS
ncbi:M23 family metallopeptidase [Haloterrigena salifodinae]|uniref:M23 family metallopeptidase n=1 Tax=Haloterrigena salifodinae TaxID=2675099 RepID=A0A8T8E4P5_9EURY|nr:M23 family metallopeptidase [Haloterrigena salifodinae]QRV16452.1 M23 family metallopeptidase [Haloterrigena salifodinae]